MTPPRWVVPLEPGPHVEGRPHVVVSVTDDLRVDIDTIGAPSGPYDSLVAVQLGASIQSAAVWAGQEKARREMRRKR